jgi:outer membrane protein
MRRRLGKITWIGWAVFLCLGPMLPPGFAQPPGESGAAVQYPPERAEVLQGGLPGIPDGNIPESKQPPAPAESRGPTSQDELPSPRTVADRPAPELNLLQTIDLAFTCNPDLRAAQERVRIASALLASARAEFYPKLGVSENFTETNTPANVFMFLLNQARFSFNRDFNHPGFIDNFLTQTQFQQPLYEGGRLQARRQAAQAQQQANTFGLRAAQNELAFHVAEAYYRLLQARNLAEVRRATVEQVQHQVQTVQTRLQAGTAVRSDVLSLEVRLAEARESLITAENQLELSWAVLENIVGARLPRLPLPSTVPPAPWTAHIDSVENAVAEAVHQRAELGEMNSQRQAALANVEAARAGNRPSVNLTGNYYVWTPNFYNGTNNLFVGLGASLNLFDGGRTRNAVRVAQARVAELAAREQRLLLDIELEVRRAYLQLADAQGRLQLTEQTTAQAAESFREIGVRYQGQAATITQCIDAQVSLTSTRVRRATAQADVEIARANLERAVGHVAELFGK